MVFICYGKLLDNKRHKATLFLYLIFYIFSFRGNIKYLNKFILFLSTYKYTILFFFTEDHRGIILNKGL
jgi:hypothetical protein